MSMASDSSSGIDAESTMSDDAEALGHEREEYPDPEDYPLPDPLDGETPDADLQVERVADPSGGEERHGRDGDTAAG